MTPQRNLTQPESRSETLSEDRYYFKANRVPTITITSEGDWYVITDEETGVTTQGETKLEALLMLADALAGYTDSDEDLVALAHDVFIPNQEILDYYDSATDN